MGGNGVSDKKDDFFSLTEDLQVRGKGMKIPIILGVDSDNKIVIEDLSKLEGILMGGQTGSGKSVFIHSVICSLLLRFSLTECKFVLIDPKRIEFVVYNRLSRLYNSVTVDPKAALDELKSLVRETDRRIKENVTNPYLIVVIDTFSDLFFTDPGKFQERICHIVSRSRETNIFIIMSDSRVGSELYTDKILNSFRTKVAFATVSEEGSSCLLGTPDACYLQGKGDMLFLMPGDTEPLHLQGINVSDSIIEAVIDRCVK